MDQAFNSISPRNRINLPPGSFSNVNRGRVEEVNAVESLPDQSSGTLTCRQLESSQNLLQRTAFPVSSLFSPVLVRRNSLFSPPKVFTIGTISRLAPRPCSGRVTSSASVVKVGAGLSSAAVSRVTHAGGQELYSQEREHSFGLLHPPSQHSVTNTTGAGAVNIDTTPITSTQYARFYVFDWDNTLCPTEWLCELYARNGQNLYLSRKPCQALNSPPAKLKIEQLQQHVRKLLLKCREKGEVAIVSNATTIGLLRTLRLLPIIQRTIDELQIAVVSSRDMCEPHGLPLEDWKDTALIHMLLDFAGRHVNAKLSVMTIGDQDFEHVALLNASEYLQQQFGRDSRPKCIKYVECPSIEAVIKQTAVFTGLLDLVSDDDSGTYMMDEDGGMWRH